MTHPKGSFVLSQEQRDTWFPDLTDGEIDGYLKPKEADINMLDIKIAQKVKDKMPLSHEEKVTYIKFKQKQVGDITRVEYKRLTGVELK